MRTPRYALVAVAALLSVAAPAGAQDAAHDEEHFDAVHHTVDGPYLDFTPFGKVELPRLFVVRGDDGLRFDAFASTSAAVASGRYHAVAHEAGEEASHAPDAAGARDAHAPEAAGAEHSADGHAPAEQSVGDADHAPAEEHAGADAHATDPLSSTLEPADGDVLIDLSITRHVVFLFGSMALLLLLLVPMGSRYRRGVGRTSAPRGLLQNMLETIVLYIRDEVAKPNLGPDYRRYLPYLLTAFFFILTANLLGLVPFGATATSNIAVTAVLAVFTFVITQLAGTRDYWMHIFSPPGVPAFVKPILIPIEILGLFTKPFALAIRLFANMTAGHLVILNFIGLIFIIRGLFGDAAGWGTAVPAVAMSVFIYALELLVAFIQAYVFTVLSALFIGMASASHEHDHNHSHEHDPTPHDRAVSESAPLLSRGEARPDRERTVGTEAAISPF